MNNYLVCLLTSLKYELIYANLANKLHPDAKFHWWTKGSFHLSCFIPRVEVVVRHLVAASAAPCLRGQTRSASSVRRSFDSARNTEFTHGQRRSRSLGLKVSLARYKCKKSVHFVQKISVIFFRKWNCNIKFLKLLARLE